MIRFDEQIVADATLADLVPDALLVAASPSALRRNSVSIGRRRPHRHTPQAGLRCLSLTIESLPYRQAARNEAITSLLARCRVGTGEAAYAPHTRSTMPSSS